MPRPDFERLNDIGAWAPPVKKSTFQEQTGASFKLSLMESETLSIARAGFRNLVARDDDVLSPDRLNELFPNVERRFEEPMSARKAAAIEAHNEERKKLQEVIANGESGFFNNATQFIASIAGAAADPIGILTGRALGTAALKVFGKAAAVAAKSTAARRIGVGAAEGVVGNVIAEGAINVPLGIKEQRDIDQQQAYLMAIGGGLVGGAGLRALGEIGGSFAKRFENLNADQRSAAVQQVENRINGGQKPDLTETELELLDRQSGQELKTQEKAALRDIKRIEQDLQRADLEPSAREELTARRVEKLTELDEVSTRMRELDERVENVNSIREELSDQSQDSGYNAEIRQELDNAELVESQTPDVVYREQIEDVRVEAQEVDAVEQFNEIEQEANFVRTNREEMYKDLFDCAEAG